jgi:hypothetical protein
MLFTGYTLVVCISKGLGCGNSLSNTFTSAFKELEPVPQFKATGELAGFVEIVV